MKKSDLKKSIKEIIVSELKESESPEFTKGYQEGYNDGYTDGTDDIRKYELPKSNLDFYLDKSRSPLKSTHSTVQGVDEVTYAGVGAVADIQKDSAFSKLKDKAAALATLKAGESVTLEGMDDDDSFEDKEPSKSDIAANSSIAKLQSKYREVVKQMKSVLNKYKSTEGSEKNKYVDQLKNLTKLKKEIEAMINPSIEDEEN